MLELLATLLPTIMKTGMVMIPEFVKALEDKRIDGEEWKQLLGNIVPAIMGQTSNPASGEPAKQGITINFVVPADSMDKLVNAILRLVTAGNTQSAIHERESVK